MLSEKVTLGYSFCCGEGREIEYEYACDVTWDDVDEYLAEAGEGKADRALGFLPDYLDDGFREWLLDRERDDAWEECFAEE